MGILCTIPLFPSVNVKWGKEKFDAVELNTEEPPMVFKAQLFALTGVQPDRQKVMVKGGTLKVQLHTAVQVLSRKYCGARFVSSEYETVLHISVVYNKAKDETESNN